MPAQQDQAHPRNLDRVEWRRPLEGSVNWNWEPIANHDLNGPWPVITVANDRPRACPAPCQRARPSRRRSEHWGTSQFPYVEKEAI